MRIELMIYLLCLHLPPPRVFVLKIKEDINWPSHFPDLKRPVEKGFITHRNLHTQRLQILKLPGIIPIRSYRVEKSILNNQQVNKTNLQRRSGRRNGSR